MTQAPPNPGRRASRTPRTATGLRARSRRRRILRNAIRRSQRRGRVRGPPAITLWRPRHSARAESRRLPASPAPGTKVGHPVPHPSHVQCPRVARKVRIGTRRAKNGGDHTMNSDAPRVVTHGRRSPAPHPGPRRTQTGRKQRSRARARIEVGKRRYFGVSSAHCVRNTSCAKAALAPMPGNLRDHAVRWGNLRYPRSGNSAGPVRRRHRVPWLSLFRRPPGVQRDSWRSFLGSVPSAGRAGCARTRARVETDLPVGNMRDAW